MAKLHASALRENMLQGIDSIGDSNRFDSREHKQVKEFSKMMSKYMAQISE